MSSYLDWQPAGWRYSDASRGSWHVHTDCRLVTVTFAPPLTTTPNDVVWLGADGATADSPHYFTSLAQAMLAVERHVAALVARSGEQLEACREVQL